jgi:hypothetical protein
MTAAQLPAGSRDYVVTDVRTGETVFGPATRTQVGHWIKQDGFWRGADLRLDVAPEPLCDEGGAR